MPTSGEAYAVDTSVAIPAVDAGHAAHGSCARIVRRLHPALAGHAAFEALSVLTRMPGDLGVDPPTALDLLQRTFSPTVWLTPKESTDLLRRLATVGITGGAIYDGLVGETARRRRLTLLTRDHRALPTYDLLGIRYQLVDT